ncbi:LOW QUALITY PROTEIN: (S)-N-methylcoclaurine 3'-hydroxylase isozyme 1-like [Wolffia australiana]
MELSSLLIFIPAILFPTILLFLLKRPTRKPANLPPGPRAWPIIGNLPYFLIRLLSSGRRLHAAFAAIAEDYGPIFHLRLGAWNVIVASSPATASQILKTSDRIFRGKYVPSAFRSPEITDLSVIWNADCDENWRSLRSLMKTHLLSLPSLSRLAPGREKKAAEMAEFMMSKAGEEVHIGKVVFATVYNIMGNLIFSRDVVSLEEGQGCFLIEKNMAMIVELGSRPSIENFFPWLVGGYDVQRLRSQVRIFSNKVYSKWDEILQQRNSNETRGEGFADVLLRSGIPYAQAKNIMQELFAAGSDTTSSLVEWVMSELVRNSAIMNRVKEELKEVMGSPSRSKKSSLAIPDESQLSRLAYLQACVKEALRLHPTVPVILHKAIDDGEVIGYAVPKGFTVMVNLWAIGRDPEKWENPLEFSPERFLSGKLDYKGMDFEFIPFGAGVRMCPGMSMGICLVELLVATMVHNFDWILPDGKQPGELCMEEKLGIVLARREPLILTPKPLT